jgi:hypothetical protein
MEVFTGFGFWYIFRAPLVMNALPLAKTAAK